MLKILTFQSVSNLYIKNEVQIQQIRMTYDTYNHIMLSNASRDHYIFIFCV